MEAQHDRPAIIALHMADGEAIARHFDPYGPWPKGGWCWVHLRRTDLDAEAWLAGVPWLSDLTVEAMLAETTRPRINAFDEGIVAIIRTIETVAGDEDDRFLALRAYCSGDRLITVMRDPVPALKVFADRLTGLEPFETPAEGLVALADALIDPVADAVFDLTETVDDIEAVEDDGDPRARRADILALRRKMVPMRRYLAPQRDAFAQLAAYKAAFIRDEERLGLREIAERITHIVEDLDAVRERALLMSEELSSQVEERMNATIYVLSLAGAIFLPLTFITGLFGMNVGGLPFVANADGFLIVTGAMAVVAIALVALLLRLRWL